MHRLNQATETGQKLLEHAAPESRGEIEGRLSSLREKWEKLNGRVETQTERLESQLELWRSYNECTDSLHRWMADIETELGAGTEPRDGLPEKRTQLKKFKVQGDDAKQYHIVCLTGEVLYVLGTENVGLGC